MIIDDEETIRRGLQQLIGRLLPEWEVVQSCPDAESALASIEETDPDLAIIDISMTGMSGLELAAELGRIKPGLYKMILTGHEKFDFLQTAMRHGVTDYLLKPLQREELVQAMHKVEAALQERQRQATAQLETLLLQWVVSQHRDRMCGLLQAYADRQGERQPLRYSVLLLQWADPATGNGGRQLERTRQALAAMAQGLREAAGIEVAEGCVLFLVGASELPSAETWRLLLQRWQQEMLAAAAVTPGERLVAYGCSEPIDGLAQLGCAYDQAIAQLREQTGDGAGVQAGTEWQRRLALAVETNDAEQTLQLLSGWAEEIRSGALQHPARLAMQAFQLLGFLTGPALAAIPSRLAERLLRAGAELSGQLPAALTPSILMQSIDAFLQTLDLSESEEQSSRKVIWKVQQLIRASYADPELNLETLAQQVYLHPTYLSELFKETTGQKFIDYLTDVRMEEARRILRETELKMYEVAAAVGYTSPKYFSTLFRKHVKLTPMGYRERAH